MSNTNIKMIFSRTAKIKALKRLRTKIDKFFDEKSFQPQMSSGASCFQGLQRIGLSNIKPRKGTETQ